MSDETTDAEHMIDNPQQQTATSSGLATASLVLGIISIVVGIFFALGWVLGLLAAILGAVAQRRPLSNRSTAVTGMWLGVVGFVLTIVVVSIRVMQ